MFTLVKRGVVIHSGRVINQIIVFQRSLTIGATESGAIRYVAGRFPPIAW